MGSKRKKFHKGWQNLRNWKKTRVASNEEESSESSCGSTYPQTPESVLHQNLQCEASETFELVKSEVEIETIWITPSHEVDSAFSFIQNLKQEYSKSCNTPTRMVQNLSVETESDGSANEPKALDSFGNEKKENNNLDIGEIASSPSHSDQGIKLKKGKIHSGIVMDKKNKKDGKTHEQRPKTKGPTSAFTLEIIADILEKPVEELDVRHWEKKIKTEFDDRIYEELIQLTRTTRRYKCFKCKAQIKGTVKDVESHMKESHDSDLVFGCFFCPLARVTGRALNAHEKLHVHYNPEVACTICDSTTQCQEFLGVNFREVHFQCHPPLDDIVTYSPKKQISGAQRCVLCEENPRNNHLSDELRKRYFTRHLLLNHVNVTALCEICGVTMNYWKLEGHLRTCRERRLVHSQGPLNCENCQFTVSTKKSLLKHDCTGKYDCRTCDAKFTTKKSIDRHMKNLHSLLRNHVCHICGKGFQESFNLQEHINTHTGEKPFQCLACGTRHTSRPGLAMHLRSWHNITIRQMKEKYKNCPVPEEPIEGEKLPKARKKDNEKKEEKINLHTGRKFGRPRIKKANGNGEARRNRGLRTTDHEPISEKGRTVKRSRKKKYDRSSDSDDDDDFLVSKIVVSEEEKDVTKKRRRLRSNFLNSDYEEGKEKMTKEGRHLNSDLSGDDSEEESRQKGRRLSSELPDSDTGEVGCEQNTQKTSAE